MSSIRKRPGKKGTTYQVRIPDETSETGFSYQTFNTMKEARAYAGDPANWKPRFDPRRMSVPEAIDLWLNICEKEGRNGRVPVSTSTHKFYTYISEIMKSYPWAKSIGELTTPDIVEFRSWLIAERSRYLAAKTITYFHAVLAEMAIRGHIDSNVATGISVRKVTRYTAPIAIPSQNDIEALLAAADRLANSPKPQVAKAWERYRPMLYLAVDSGMRPQEYFALAGANITETGIQVERAIDRGGKLSVPKTPASRRFIEISPETLEMITYYRDKKRAKNDFDLVFPTAKGTWQGLSNWRDRCFNAACIEAGLVIEDKDDNGRRVIRAKYTPYDLRHFYASMLIAQRVNLKKIQTLMGHKNITTTFDVYGHLIERDENDATASLGMLSRMRS